MRASQEASSLQGLIVFPIKNLLAFPFEKNLTNWRGATLFNNDRTPPPYQGQWQKSRALLGIEPRIPDYESGVCQHFSASQPLGLCIIDN